MFWEPCSVMQVPLKAVLRNTADFHGNSKGPEWAFYPVIWWEDSLTSESFIWIPPVFGDSAVQHCGRFIYCWWPSVLLCKMLNLTMQARYLRFHNLPKCVRSISKGFFAGKEYNSVRKHFVVFSSMIATMEKSHLSNKKRKTHTRKRKKPST